MLHHQSVIATAGPILKLRKMHCHHVHAVPGYMTFAIAPWKSKAQVFIGNLNLSQSHRSLGSRTHKALMWCNPTEQKFVVTPQVTLAVEQGQWTRPDIRRTDGEIRVLACDTRCIIAILALADDHAAACCA